MTKYAPGFSTSKTVPYALNLCLPMLWNTRFEIARSYGTSEFNGFVRSLLEERRSGVDPQRLHVLHCHVYRKLGDAAMPE
jgi:hypothetical protein